MKTPIFVLAGFVVVMLTGCANGPRERFTAGNPVMNTTSGRPEVRIHATSPEDVRSVAKNFFVDSGYVVKDPDVTGLTFDRIHYKSPLNYPGVPTGVRVRLKIYPQPNGDSVVVGTPYGVDNLAHTWEDEVVIASAYPEVQRMLREIKSTAEQK